MQDSASSLLDYVVESLKIVCSMIDQVIAAHPGIQWFHIGCDEVGSTEILISTNV